MKSSITDFRSGVSPILSARRQPPRWIKPDFKAEATSSIRPSCSGPITALEQPPEPFSAGYRAFAKPAFERISLLPVKIHNALYKRQDGIFCTYSYLKISLIRSSLASSSTLSLRASPAFCFRSSASLAWNSFTACSSGEALMVMGSGCRDGWLDKS